MTSNTNFEEEEIVDTLGNDDNYDNVSMQEQFNRPNPWRKMIMVMMRPNHNLMEEDDNGNDETQS
jgi:hypothetical protein